MKNVFHFSFVLPFIALLVIIGIKGDALYLGVYYYLVSFAILATIFYLAKAKPAFSFAISFIYVSSVIIYMTFNWFTDKPEGLLGLGHTFSMPGFVVGLILSLIYIKRSKQESNINVFFIGALTTTIGFLINQLIICNTFFDCGAFSLL